MNEPHPAFDKNWMLAQIGGDEGLLREVAAVFLDDWPRLREELAQALSRQDSSALRLAAHATKSAVGNFGAKDALEAAKALETACREGAEALYAKHHAALLSEAERLAAELRTELGQ